MTNKLLVICGLTAVGKTSLGIRLAKKFKGEIISADSRQVYRGMDIGTGKDITVNSKLKVKSEKLQLKIQNRQILRPYRFDKIPVWLLDVVDPNQEFSVAHYVTLAREVIKDIWRRNKLPIAVGGTGFYIKGLIDGIGTLGVRPDWKMRRILGDYDTKILGEMLQELDPERWKRMNQSDRQNPRRLARAIEIALRKQNVKRDTQNELKCKIDEILIIGLKAPNEILYRRIDRRVEKRVKQEIEGEIRKLLRKGYDWKDSALGTTLGYQEWQPYFRKRKAGKEILKRIKEKVIQRWKFNEHHYARRQMTWFKKDKRINWFNIAKAGFDKDVVKLAKAWYSKTDAAEN